MTVKELKESWVNEKTDCEKERRKYAVKTMLCGVLTLVFLVRAIVNYGKHGVFYGSIGMTDYILDKIDD